MRDGSRDEADSGGQFGRSGSASSPWCRALSVLQSNCQQCHGSETQAGAPMSMTSFTELVAPAFSAPEKKVYELVKVRIHDIRSPMPPLHALTADEVAALDSWIDDGAQAGPDVACTGLTSDAGASALEQEAWPADCELHYTIRAHDPNDPSKPFRVGPGQEIQRSITIEAPWGDEPLQALMFKPRNDNQKILHHWVLYAGVPEPVEADAGIQNPSSGAFVWGWVPGGAGTVKLPDDVGLFLPTGRLSLDMHYYNVAGTNEEFDQSGVEICATRKFRPHTAGVTKDFNAFPSLPPNQREAAEDVCRVITTTDEDLHLLSVAPHMHKLGERAFLSVTHGFTETVLHDQPFSFDSQRSYPLSDVRIQSGDVVTTRCTFNNTTNRVVEYGPSSDEEMCANFAIYWPLDGYFCLGL
jgi:hypothetical protein